jgi:hypothetical protein
MVAKARDKGDAKKQGLGYRPTQKQGKRPFIFIITLTIAQAHTGGYCKHRQKGKNFSLV